MRTKKSIQSAIDAVVNVNFGSTLTHVEHSDDYTRIHADSLHGSDIQSIMSLVDVIKMNNKYDRNVFLMVDTQKVWKDDLAYKALGLSREKHVTSIFIFYRK